jgi:hypothetical protein
MLPLYTIHWRLPRLWDAAGGTKRRGSGRFITTDTGRDDIALSRRRIDSLTVINVSENEMLIRSSAFASR